VVKINTVICPICGGHLSGYDKVSRLVRYRRGAKGHICLKRLQCIKCGRVHREMLDSIYPHKHYTRDIIDGVVEGLITPETFGFEDYPCELTMAKWLINNPLTSF